MAKTWFMVHDPRPMGTPQPSVGPAWTIWRGRRLGRVPMVACRKPLDADGRDELTYPTDPWERQTTADGPASPDRYHPNRSASLRSFAGTTLSERVEKSLSSKREKIPKRQKDTCRYRDRRGLPARRCSAQVGLGTVWSSDHGPGTGSGEAVGKSGRFQFGTPSW
jgi:hypothetical protein